MISESRISPYLFKDIFHCDIFDNFDYAITALDRLNKIDISDELISFVSSDRKDLLFCLLFFIDEKDKRSTSSVLSFIQDYFGVALFYSFEEQKRQKSPHTSINNKNKSLMNILGIHAYSHEAGACLICNDGVCAISQERLTGIKYDGGFPRESIEYVMEYFNIKDINDIDLVVFDRLGLPEDYKKTINELKGVGYKKDMIGIDHHDAHAASAFFMSPFDHSAILVIDGFGTSSYNSDRDSNYLFRLEEPVRETQSIYTGRDNEIKLIRRTFATPQYQFGIGLLYAFSSMFLGFGELGAGKLMALAAYGGRKKAVKNRFLEQFNGEIAGKGVKDMDPTDFDNLQSYGKRIFNYSTPRQEGDPIKKIHSEIAHFTQRETEEAVLYLVNDLYEITNSKNLCYSGGVALNCITNSRIIGESNFTNVFIQPAATDCGIPLGCALYGYHVEKSMPRRFIMKDVFLGREYNEEEILYVLKNQKNIEYTKPRDLTKKTARYLSEGKIIGWFQGRSEMGPRALGHRSILADPRDPNIKDILNKGVKKREWFRPYAPSVLEELAGEYFEIYTNSPFMLLAPKVKKDKKELIPAVIHIDGTARLQIVKKDILPRFYKLIKEFYKITGIPMILNTSFNLSGEPIVETPEDALRCFLKTNIDYLIIENYLICKRNEDKHSLNRHSKKNDIDEEIKLIFDS